MSLSNNTNTPTKAPVRVSKPNGHTGTPRDRQGSDILKDTTGFRVPSQAYKDNYDAIFNKKTN